jgi:hypothetical protein
MQDRVQAFAVTRTPTATAVHLGIKVAVAAGPVRCFLVGDPAIQVLEVLAGDTVMRIAAAEWQSCYRGANHKRKVVPPVRSTSIRPLSCSRPISSIRLSPSEVGWVQSKSAGRPTPLSLTVRR